MHALDHEYISSADISYPYAPHNNINIICPRQGLNSVLRLEGADDLTRVNTLETVVSRNFFFIIQLC